MNFTMPLSASRNYKTLFLLESNLIRIIFIEEPLWVWPEESVENMQNPGLGAHNSMGKMPKDNSRLKLNCVA